MDSGYPTIVLAPVAGLALNCMSQIAVARAFPARSPYHSMAAGMLVGLVASIAATVVGLHDSDFTIVDCVGFHLLNLMSYLALAFGYFNFVNLTIASLRIRLLRELDAAGGSLSKTSLLDTYGTRSVIDLRIQRLVRGGHLRQRDGRYFIGKKRFLAVALVYNALRWLVIGPWPTHTDDN